MRHVRRLSALLVYVPLVLAVIGVAGLMLRMAMVVSSGYSPNPFDYRY